jgi:hypothetical protein
MDQPRGKLQLLGAFRRSWKTTAYEESTSVCLRLARNPKFTGKNHGFTEILMAGAVAADAC